MFKKLCAIFTGLFCLMHLLQAIPAEALEPFDYFIVTEANKNLADYYYYINGVRYCIPADFSLMNEMLRYNGLFTIDGEFYIKNEIPLKIKLAPDATLSYMYDADKLYVIGVDDIEHPQEYCLITSGSQPTVFTSEELKPFMIDEKFELGDILYSCDLHVSIKNKNIIIQNYEYSSETLPQALIVGGSIKDNLDIQEFTVYSKHDQSVEIKNDNTKKYIVYSIPENFVTFPAPEFSSLKRNQNVFCITENGIPIALYDAEIKPNGDADGNQETDILDVIQVNKAILGKEALSSERIPYIDFNHNGIPDSSDSLMILKLIVGLVNF